MQLPDKIEIVAADDFQVDFVTVSAENNVVVIAFSELGTKALHNYGFGGPFLLHNGFDVIAVKSQRDDWHASFEVDMLPFVVDFLKNAPKNYAHIACYGSSMGAYAAIRYAKALSAKSVFAISPQFQITWPQDRRWASYADRLGEIKRLDARDMAGDCIYHIAFDPLDLDLLHAQGFAALSSNVKLIQVRFSGHPSGGMLHEMGKLKPMAGALLSGGSFDEWREGYRSMRRSSSRFLLALGTALINRKKPAWALNVLRAALRIRPLDADLLVKASLAADRSGETFEALQFAATAAALRPAHHAILAWLADLLWRQGQRESARFYIDKAVALNGLDSHKAAQRRMQV